MTTVHLKNPSVNDHLTSLCEWTLSFRLECPLSLCIFIPTKDGKRTKFLSSTFILILLLRRRPTGAGVGHPFSMSVWFTLPDLSQGQTSSGPLPPLSWGRGVQHEVTQPFKHNDKYVVEKRVIVHDDPVYTPIINGSVVCPVCKRTLVRTSL